MRLYSLTAHYCHGNARRPIHALSKRKVENPAVISRPKYVDEVDREALVSGSDRADAGKKLDPHSYITAEQLREVNEQLEGNFDGIGVEFVMLDDTIVVVARWRRLF